MDDHQGVSPRSRATQTRVAPLSRERPKVKRVLFYFIALLLLGLALIWAANDVGWIPGPWAQLVAILFTLLGVLLALYVVFFENRE